MIDSFAIDRRCSIIGDISVAYDRHIRHKATSLMFTKSFAKKSSRLLQKELEKNKYDCVIAFAPYSSAALAFLDVDIPVLLVIDAVFSNLFNYYLFVDPKVEKTMNEIQKKALENSARIIVTSDWAKQAASNDYHISPDKVDVIHFGANVEAVDVKPAQHEGINLLFVGKDGKRKGVDVAIECVKELNNMDPETRYQLNIVGCDWECDDPAVHVHGFLNRNNQNERELLDHLRATSDFFIMPTRAEAAGIVFCEADAYSLPSISYRTGGVPDYVLDGENGTLLDISCNGKDFAEKIIEILNDKSRLDKMKKRAYELYCEEYNWEKCGSSLRKIIEEVTE